jgi:hypothetical protein
VLHFSLRRYDTQARFGVVLCVLAIGGLLAMAAFILTADQGFKNFSFKDMTVTYGPLRKTLVYASGAVTLLLAVCGFGFGLSSAGQRRNDKPTLSWISFFVGGAVACLALVLLFFFMRQGQSVIH